MTAAGLADVRYVQRAWGMISILAGTRPPGSVPA